MNPKIRGAICGIASAAFYGCNPLGALGLYELGINSNTVLFFRFLLASLILAGLMLVRRESFSLTRKESGLVLILGVIFCMTSLLMFISFHYIDAGIASTLIFVYPVMVAVIMAVFFREKITLLTCGSIALSLAGIGLLYHGDGDTLNTTGVLLVMLAAFFNALYIIVINRTKLNIPAVKMTFYVSVVSIFMVYAYSLTGENQQIQWLTTPAMWGYALFMAFVPTVLALVLMAVAIRDIGSTPTAIMGALEPVSAVMIGVLMFGEKFTLQILFGIILIMSSVLVIILAKNRVEKDKEKKIDAACPSGKSAPE
ncbi:MAG: DMT family transporter [Oxalobacter sp.]